SPSTARSRRFAMSISSTTDELNMQMIVQVFDRRHNRKPNKTKEIRRAWLALAPGWIDPGKRLSTR
ncbi:MAG TPA: hypothetical protein VM282_22255, partial [Acidimicrobiales bacterium]|nr:hypothetical protein [Acidimicrobiales bacterium]